VSDKDPALKVSSGVEELIQRLRDQGVADGRAEAEKIVAEAESRARWIVQQAEEEAERLRSKTQAEVEHLKNAGREALNTAARDAMLALKARLTQRFTNEVRRLVGQEMEKQELLQRMILEVAGAVKEDVAGAEYVDVLLPQNVVGLQELSRDHKELEEGVLTHFVRLVGRDMLQEGIEFDIAEDHQGGLRFYLKDQNVVLDLSDGAVAAMLLEHLQPRFRALLEGMVK